MVVVEPSREVTVAQPDGVWPGWLTAWRRTDAGWRAFVRYRREPGMTYLAWVDADDVAPVVDEQPTDAAAGLPCASTASPVALPHRPDVCW